MELLNAREGSWLKENRYATQNIPFIFIDSVGSLSHKREEKERKLERKRHSGVGYED
jgi:hypothetical protein